MPEFSFSYLCHYKEAVYPVMALLRQLQTEGRLTPVQVALMAPRLPDEELYDLEADPYEIYNLALSPKPEHQQVRQELSTVLAQWIEATNDQGRTPESPELIRQWVVEMEKVFGTPAWAKAGEVKTSDVPPTK